MPQGGMSDEPREMDADQSSRTDGDPIGAATESEKVEGRPSDSPPATPADTGRPDAVRETSTETSGGTEGTIAPEEKGAQPETEHAPGSDL